MEKKKSKPLVLIDLRTFARELNEYNLDKKKTDNYLISFFKRIEPKGYINNLDLEFIIQALRKSGAMEIEKEPIVCWKKYSNGTFGIDVGYPVRFDVKYQGPVDLKKFYELIYN
ncbi:MAG: hypothetical protein KKF52_00900 [Nanoarchaeota archaeon]|nr:hypothetical protein [Nanoarchaeota archaeon]MBU4241766.1 hypothetical protein [Nanoarchaeota archaeon]MBU4351747.1 hypothetical protein [Nanoarchaeota archaeon]